MRELNLFSVSTDILSSRFSTMLFSVVLSSGNIVLVSSSVLSSSEFPVSVSGTKIVASSKESVLTTL